MRQAEVEQWMTTPSVGDEVGVFAGSRMLFKTKIIKRTPSGRVMCEPGGTFKPTGEIHGRLAVQDRCLRPLAN